MLVFLYCPVIISAPQKTWILPKVTNYPPGHQTVCLAQPLSSWIANADRLYRSFQKQMLHFNTLDCSSSYNKLLMPTGFFKSECIQRDPN